LLLSADLLDSSRVTGHARATGAEVRVARTPAELLAAARAVPPGGVLIDLHHPGLDLSALLAGLREACPTMPRVVAYGSHVASDVLRAARQAGCDLVLPRSKFVEQLPTSLGGWLGA
jgi:DNA-binding NarL/FixJ family response regulator